MFRVCFLSLADLTDFADLIFYRVMGVRSQRSALSAPSARDNSTKSSIRESCAWPAILAVTKWHLAAKQVTSCRRSSYASRLLKCHFDVVKPMVWHGENYVLTAWNLCFYIVKVPLLQQKTLFLCRQHVGKMYANPGNHVGNMYANFRLTVCETTC